MNWVLAVTFICGASVFTSCSANDANDNPSQEQAKKDRKEFIQHTRQNLKEMAENLNFRSWDAANELNIYFNQYVLNNPGFEKAVLATFMRKTQQSIKPVEEGSELAEMGYYSYGTVDLTDFNYLKLYSMVGTLRHSSWGTVFTNLRCSRAATRASSSCMPRDISWERHSLLCCHPSFNLPYPLTLTVSGKSTSAAVSRIRSAWQKVMSMHS